MVLQKRCGIFLLLFLLMFLFTGCSGSKKEEAVTTKPTPSPVPTQAVEETDTAEQAAEEVTDVKETTDVSDGVVKNVAFISYMDDTSFNAIRENCMNTLADKGYVDGKNMALTVYNLNGDVTNCATILEQIKALKPDLLLTDGTGVSELIIKPLENEGIPIIMALDADNSTYGFGKPGGYITGIRTMPSDLQSNAFKMLDRLFPINGKKAVFITNGTIKMFTEQGIKDALSQLNVELKAFVEVENFSEYKDAVMSYVNDDEVGWILNGTWTPIDKEKNAVSRADFVSWTNENNPKACITWWEANVAVGMLMGLAVDTPSLGFQVGEMAAEVLNGKPIGELAVQDPEVINVMINSKRAKDMGIEIPADILGAAKIYIDYEGTKLQ